LFPPLFIQLNRPYIRGETKKDQQKKVRSFQKKWYKGNRDRNITKTVGRVEEIMFQKVTSRTDLEIFNKIWKTSFSQKKYELEEYEWDSKRFLVENQFGEKKGTVELIPYTMDKKKSTIEDMFEFSSLEMTKKTSLQHIYEIDKLSVSEEGRKEGTLENILQFLIEFAIENNVFYYYALINPLLFRAIKISYGFPVEKAGKIIKTESYPIQPMYINMKKTLQTQNWKGKEMIKK
jgi:hypothetical protein